MFNQVKKAALALPSASLSARAVQADTTTVWADVDATRLLLNAAGIPLSDGVEMRWRAGGTRPGHVACTGRVCMYAHDPGRVVTARPGADATLSPRSPWGGAGDVSAVVSLNGTDVDTRGHGVAKGGLFTGHWRWATSG